MAHFETGQTKWAGETAAQKDTDSNRFQLERIANALEEVLRLVKEDQERMRKLNDQKSQQPSGFNKPLALARGQWLQEGSGKLQAPSRKLDKTAIQDYKGSRKKK